MSYSDVPSPTKGERSLGVCLPGARFSKVPIINGPVKLFGFT